MTTAAGRLRQLAGRSGTAAALLLAIGSGNTAGAILLDHSPLAHATAAEHLLASKWTVYGGGRDDDDARTHRLATQQPGSNLRVRTSATPDPTPEPTRLAAPASGSTAVAVGYGATEYQAWPARTGEHGLQSSSGYNDIAINGATDDAAAAAILLAMVLLEDD